ncbi:MAG: hypothetical protein ACTSRU_19545 [Candidatus Hodarchaeales archaeon]
MEDECKDLLMIQAPTWEVDYTLSSKVLRAKYSENPVSYNAEYGAQFSDRVTGWIENEQILRMNIIPGLRTKTRSYERTPHFMGIDIGLKNDGTAIAIGHIVRESHGDGQKDFIELDCIDVRYASDEDKEFFHPEEMAEWIAEYSEKFFIVKGIMDQYYGMAIVPLLEERGVKQIHTVQATRDFSSRVYQNLMSKLLDASLRIPEGKEKIVDGKKTKDLDLVSELLRLQATIHSKYLITVRAPEVKGIHDDMSDAFARSVFLATEYMSSGGGIAKHNVTANTGSSMSYKKYSTKHRKNAIYTNRPSSGLQSEMVISRHSTGMGRLGTSLNRFGR